MNRTIKLRINKLSNSLNILKEFNRSNKITPTMKIKTTSRKKIARFNRV